MLRLITILGLTFASPALAQTYPNYDQKGTNIHKQINHDIDRVRADSGFEVLDKTYQRPKTAPLPETAHIFKSKGFESSTLGQGIKVGVVGGGYNPFHPELRSLSKNGQPRVIDVTPDLEDPFSDEMLEGKFAKCVRSVRKDAYQGAVTTLAACEHHPGQHDTMVLSIIGGAADGQGITGLVPAAELYFATAAGGDGDHGKNIANAITALMQHLEFGDILLIEAQGKFEIPSGTTCQNKQAYTDQGGPAELEPQVYTAIRAATRKGITVVQGAGNSGVSLDPSPSYDPANPSTARCADVQLYAWSQKLNSGSVIVGATNAQMSARLPKSNFGKRVDTASLGRGIRAAGYSYSGGDNTSTSSYRKIYPGSWPTSEQFGLYADCTRDVGKKTGFGGKTKATKDLCAVSPDLILEGLKDAQVYYTDDFGGTSGASAVAAALLAGVQSAAKNARTGPKRPDQLRTILSWAYDREVAGIGPVMNFRSLVHVAVVGRIPPD